LEAPEGAELAAGAVEEAAAAVSLLSLPSEAAGAELAAAAWADRVAVVVFPVAAQAAVNK
jgi:hypothetical protein